MVRPLRMARWAIVALIFTAAAALAEDAVLDGFEPGLFRDSKGKTLHYRFFQPELRYGERYPLILFLHGLEAVGGDNRRQISGMDRAGSHVWTEHGWQSVYPAFVLAPQCPRGSLWVNLLTRRPTAPLRRAVELVRDLVRQYPIDPGRVYVTGQSMGGFGAWVAAGENPDLFAAAVPVCGGASKRYARALAGLSVWAFHGSADLVVPSRESRRMISAIRKAGGAPLYTEYPFGFHNVWNVTYSNPALMVWLFAQRKSAGAGSRQTAGESCPGSVFDCGFAFDTGF